MDKHDHGAIPVYSIIKRQIQPEEVSKIETKYSKVVSCKYSCGTIMNRDVNAAQNIRMLTAYLVCQHPRPSIFTKNNKAPRQWATIRGSYDYEYLVVTYIIRFSRIRKMEENLNKKVSQFWVN